MPRAILGIPQIYPFESESVMGVEQADVYLSRKYGDYMVIPDGDHQRQHNFNVLDLDIPYREFAAK